MGGWARYMAPVGDFVGDDGAVDVAFQFHGAEVADKDWRQSGLNALIVSVTYPGWGTVQYKSGLHDPIHIGEILDDALKRVGATRVRRLLLVSWSAGYALRWSIALGNAHYFALADTIIVLDGMHADLIGGKPDERPIAIFERYARDAVAGKKTMLVVHSSIIPPNYASTTQMAELLCASVGVRRIEEVRTREDGMVEFYHADAGGLHVRGFRGEGPRDHLDQLHLLDDLVREHVTPRWTRLALDGAHQHPGTNAGGSDDALVHRLPPFPGPSPRSRGEGSRRALLPFPPKSGGKGRGKGGRPRRYFLPPCRRAPARSAPAASASPCRAECPPAVCFASTRGAPSICARSWPE